MLFSLPSNILLLGGFECFTKNRDILKVTVKKKPSVQLQGTPITFSFEVKANIFSVTSTKSFGIIKLQGYKFTNMARRKFKLIYIGWNNANRCLFKPPENTEIHFLTLDYITIEILIRISTTGHKRGL